MPRIPPSFYFFVFLPKLGVTAKCVCDTTSTDATSAEVKDAELVADAKRSLRALPDPDTQRAIDEAASDMLELACARAGVGDTLEQIEARLERESLDRALAAQERWNELPGHPYDVGAPAWCEYA